MPAVSVIVPVYNAREYLSEALDSLISQTLRDIEIICINDGSTDDSHDTLLSYSSQDERIVVINRENAGYGSAMNLGIEEASGEYIGILEPDDFVDCQMFEELYNASFLEGERSRADVVKSSFYYFTEKSSYRPALINEPSLVKQMPSQTCQCVYEDYRCLLKEHPAIWSGIYRKQFLLDKGIRFVEPPGAGWADNPFIFETLCQAEVFVWVPNAYYYYRCSNEEASSYLSDYNIPLDRLRDILDFLERAEITDQQTWDLVNHRVFNYLFSILNGMSFECEQPGLYEKTQALFERLDGKLIEDSRLLNNQRKRFYKEFSGALDSRFEHQDAVDKAMSKDIAVVIPIHNSCRYVYSILEECLKGNDTGVQVICLDECESWDFTRRFVSQIAGKDHRVLYRQEDLKELLLDTQVEHYYFPGFRSSIDGSLVSKLLKSVNDADADMIVYGACPEGVSAGSKIALETVRDFFISETPCALSDICFSRSLLLSLAMQEPHDLTLHMGRGLLLEALFAGETVVFHDEKLSAPIEKSNEVPSFNARVNDVAFPNTETGYLCAIFDSLSDRGQFDGIRQTLPSLVTRIALEELMQQKQYSRFSQLASAFKESAMMRYLGDGYFDRLITKGSAEELLYYALYEPALFKEAIAASDKSDLYAKLVDARNVAKRKDRMLKKREKELKAIENRPVSRLAKKVRRAFR